MADIWLDWTVHRPVYGKGYGPFGHGLPLGWVLHVNQSHGNLDAFFAGDESVNPSSVCPNFQVYQDGTVHQHLPLLSAPWCQVDGNTTYGAVETEGMDSEPLTAAQVRSIGRIHNAYHQYGAVPDQVANAPGQHGIGIHSMGGASWGGHACPGTIRAGQRTAIIQAAQAIRATSATPVHPAPTPAPAPAAPKPAAPAAGRDGVYLVTNVGVNPHASVLVLSGVPVAVHTPGSVAALVASGVRNIELPADRFAALMARLGGVVG